MARWCTTPRSCSVSLAPHDSANKSEAAQYSPNQFAIHLEKYTVEVLWSLEDCRNDPDVGMSFTNQSRPSMEKAVQCLDGCMISATEWATIKRSACTTSVDLMQLPPAKTQHCTQSKTYFKTNFPNEWQAALEHMERDQLLLALCSFHWKADHVLANTLQAKTKHSKK